MQKAFIPGINGCIEHNVIMEEAIKQARVGKKTLHATLFDVEDAFSSVPHTLIQETLVRNHLPPNIIQYFSSCYTQAQAVVETPSWRSAPFPFRRGVFQGDPISPIIFLMVFNPILQDLKREEERIGFKIGDSHHVTLPYADDFCL